MIYLYIKKFLSINSQKGVQFGITVDLLFGIIFCGDSCLLIWRWSKESSRVEMMREKGKKR